MNICIVGTGYVGLVTAACLAEMATISFALIAILRSLPV